MRKMLAEFKAFALKGNVLDLAVGIIIGAAFTTVVNSLVNDIIMPPVGRLLGGVDFSNIFINLSDTAVESVEKAAELGIPTINIGIFINAIINFLIVAAAVFLLVRAANSAMKGKEVAAVAEPDPVPDPMLVTQQQILATLEKLNTTLDKK